MTSSRANPSWRADSTPDGAAINAGPCGRPLLKAKLLTEPEAVTYSRLLLAKKQGFPLWSPEPSSGLPKEYQDSGITVGDIGFITPDGGFSFLFNVCQSSDHPVNVHRVPGDFEPFELDGEDVQETAGWHAPGSVITGSSVSWEGTLEPSGFTAGGMRFSCSPREGAFLVLPEGGTHVDVTGLDSLRRYAAKNARNWYEWVNGASSGQTVRNGSLYLVTGVDKTASWGMACFGSSHEKSSMTFSAADGGVGECPYVWESSGRGQTRAGPKRGWEQEQEQGPSSRRKENQCVFVRGFLLELNDAGGVASPLESAGLSSRMDPVQRDKVSENKLFHPSAVINQHLLSVVSLSFAYPKGLWLTWSQYPDAEVSLAHDDDWCSVLGETVPDGPDLLNQILAQRHPHREDASVYLDPTRNLISQDMVSANVAAAVAPPYATSRTSRTPSHFQSYHTDPHSNRYTYSSSFADVSTPRKPETLSRTTSVESGIIPPRQSGNASGSGKEPDLRPSSKQADPLPTIDMEIFRQILDLDEDDNTYEFSWGMAWAYFSQAKTTFEEMNDALARKDLAKLSSLGHFLKGSSAALGVARVQASCEKIQHYGLLRDEDLGIDLTPQQATEKIKRLLVEVQADYKVAEQWLRDWFGSRRSEG